jgi:hypothetical protein|tara:strand:+ start:8490 stop:8894 length:405 start_codon:yes stop_codon:yes gene_type:complete
MNELVVAASIVKNDEPALRLEELNVQGIKGQGMQRRQFIHVIRDDRRAVWSQDLGNADSFHAPPFRIPSLMEHTVEELREIADQLRESKQGANRIQELSEASTMLEDAIEQAEQRTLEMRRATVSGPSITVERH